MCFERTSYFHGSELGGVIWQVSAFMDVTESRFCTLRRERYETALLVVALVLMISAGAAAWASPKVDPSQFTVNMHVSKSYLEVLPDRPLNSVAQRLDVTIDGHHLVVDGRSAVGEKPEALFPVGDYKARVKKEGSDPNGAYWRQYEILLKDGSTWAGNVMSESE
jgi:hypothetical protein